MSAGPQRRLTETLTFISGLNQEAYLYPGAFNLDKQGRLEAFAGGQAAFMVGSVEDIDTLRRRMGEAAFSVSSVPTPDTYADKPVFGLAEWSLGVSSQGLYQEEARQFASFLAAQASRLAEQAHAAPGATDSFYEKVWDLYAESDLVQEPPVLASRPGLETGLRSILSGLFAGLLSPDEAAKALGDPL
jgi:ABC-type glycerol-3-phosphate transport system substrate-binding protein